MLSTEKEGLELALQLIKHFEGCRLQAYVLPGEAWATIGWGHALTLSQRHKVWTQAQADGQLLQDLASRNEGLRFQLGKLYDLLTAGQLGASLSFKYNCRPNLFDRSTFLLRVRQGNMPEACQELRRWTHGEGNKELAGLEARRKSEQFVWNGGGIHELASLHRWFQS